MENTKSMKEYIARTRSLALSVKYRDIEVTEQEISRQVLNDLPLAYAPEKRNFALKTDFILGDLEGDLVRLEELYRSLDGTDDSHALAAGFKAKNGGQSKRSISTGAWTGPMAAMPWSLVSKPKAAASGRSGGRGGRNGGGRGKRDGKGHQRISGSRNNSSISRGISNISDRGCNSGTSGISRDISRSSPHIIQGDGVHHAFVSGLVNTGVFCQIAVQYPLHRIRVFLTRTRAHKLPHIHILETSPILGGGLLHHRSQPPRRRTRMDRPFRPSRFRALSPTRSP